MNSASMTPMHCGQDERLIDNAEPDEDLLSQPLQ